jgi:hypothetical protein
MIYLPKKALFCPQIGQFRPHFMSKDTATNTAPKSVVIKVSIPNRPDSENNKKKSMFNRLSNYAKDKGLKETDIIRFFISIGLDKAGY